jgi:hypothetical protein
MDRNASGLGIAFLAEPSPAWRDGDTGGKISNRGVEFGLAMDAALVPQRVFASLNVSYGLDATRVQDVDGVERASGLGLSSAIAYRFSDAFFLGAEARYNRAYEGLGLDTLQGEALFLGPTLFWKPNDRLSVTATCSTQICGRDLIDPAARFDLNNFERHEAKIKVAGPF